jgi:hypothetical protein
MSLNISSENTNATSMQSLVRAAGMTGTRLAKRPVADHMPDAADAALKPGSPAERPDRPPLQTHPAASTDDPLQRLPESGESGKQRVRAKKGAAEQILAPQQRASCPYDPSPMRQRDLDLLA